MNRALTALAALAIASPALAGDVEATATANSIAVDAGGPCAYTRRSALFESPADKTAHRSDFAKFKEECRKGVFVIGQASSMENVRPRAGFQWHMADEVKVRLARGERESVQILVAPANHDLKDVKVAVDGDLGAFAATNVAASVVGYVLTTNVPPYKVRPGDNPPALGWWPDPILDFQQSCDIFGADVQSFWVRVTCPRDQAAGIYRGALVVSAAGEEPVRIPFTVRVNGFAIGRKSPIPLAITCSAPGGRKDVALKAAADTNHYWNAHATREREYSDFFADYFITRSTIYRGEPFWDTLARLRDEDRLGMFCLSHFGGLGDMPNAEVAWRKRWDVQTIHARYEKARELGILDKAYFYGCDEAKPPAHTNVQRAAEFLHREFPGVPVMTTARDKLLGTGDSPLRDIDIHCPALCFWEERPVREAKEAGKKVWRYFCNIPSWPFADSMIEAPPAELRSLMGAQTWKFKSDGFLYYSTMRWTSDKPITQGPYTDWNACSLGPFHGDGQWTCCGGPEMLPLATLRLENFRDGLEDLWYAKLLEEKLREVTSGQSPVASDKDAADSSLATRNSSPGEADWLRRAKEALAVPDEVARLVSDFSTDPEVIYRWRDEMADLIEEAAR